MKLATTLCAIFWGLLLICHPSFAVGSIKAGQYKITQLPLSDSADYDCGTKCQTGNFDDFYTLEQLDSPLRELMAEQSERNVFGLDGSGDDGYYILPAKGDVQVIIATRAIVVNSMRLLTLKDNQLIDQLLISFGGPDDEMVMDFSLDKDYHLKIRKGTSDTDHENPPVWSELREYELDANGKLLEVKKTSLIN